MEKFVPVEKLEKKTGKKKIKNAERSVIERLDEKLAEILDRIGESPYFETERNFN